jgi:ankyrin repeat protein
MREIGYMVNGFLVETKINHVNNAVKSYMVATFINAANDGNLKLIVSILKQGIVGINAKFLGFTALYGAVLNDREDVVKYLIKNGADINAKSGPAQRTALHQAVKDGRLELVKILLSNGADASIRNVEGRTPIYYVNLYNPKNKAEIKILLKKAENQQLKKIEYGNVQNSASNPSSLR